MRPRTLWRTLAAVLVLGSGAALAAQRFQFQPQVDEASLIHNVPYDGRFTFARVRYTTGPGGFYYQGLPAWAHGYPRAERDLLQIMHAVSNIDGRLGEGEVLGLDDPELTKYPVAYMTEPGYWVMNDTEAAGLHAYLQKGGFLIVDDFRDNFRGGGGWPNFEANMHRVFPELRFIDLDPRLPVFHAFFEIDSFDIVQQFYDRGRPIFRGLFEDNDPTKRLVVMVNFNTDVSNFWEFSATSYLPVEASNEAYKLGVNYLIYGLTH